MTPAADLSPTIPAGRWAVGVSGGADSVALALLTARAATARGDGVVFAHLDHQLRGDASNADAAFVEALGRRIGVPTIVARRDAVERAAAARHDNLRGTGVPPVFLKTANTGGTPVPRNASARYRAARLAFFAGVVRQHDCRGVLLAHHADDQAETVLLRLLRGRGLLGLGGIAADTRIGLPSGESLRVVRPLLGVSRQYLRNLLHAAGQNWREDASNDSADYRRNVVRKLLAANAHWTPPLLRVAAASSAAREQVEKSTPSLGESFGVRDLPADPLAAEWAIRHWLLARGAPADRVSPVVCRRLFEQATDVTQPPRQHFPGRILVRRRQRRVDAVPASPLQSADTHG